jgi:hypothetical protein
MLRVWFETMTPTLERAKTVHALDRAANVICRQNTYPGVYLVLQRFTYILNLLN